jgi:hypothetical protein
MRTGLGVALSAALQHIQSVTSLTIIAELSPYGLAGRIGGLAFEPTW